MIMVLFIYESDGRALGSERRTLWWAQSNIPIASYLVYMFAGGPCWLVMDTDNCRKCLHQLQNSFRQDCNLAMQLSGFAKIISRVDHSNAAPSVNCSDVLLMLERSHGLKTATLCLVLPTEPATMTKRILFQDKEEHIWTTTSLIFKTRSSMPLNSR